MAKDPSAHLRRLSRADQNAANTRDRDNTKAVIRYMRERGAFADHIPASNHGVEYDIRPVVEGLPWNPSAPKRIVRLELYERVKGYQERQGRRYVYVRPHDVFVASVPIPHWDYDGLPTESREAWEHEQADQMLDHQAQYRIQDADVAWSVGHMANELDCMESMIEDGSNFDMEVEYAATRALCDVWTSQP